MDWPRQARYAPPLDFTVYGSSTGQTTMPIAERTIPFADLPTADLPVDATLEGGRSGNVGDDPISRAFGCGNQGGFRSTRPKGANRYGLVVLYSALDDPDWPDYLDVHSGRFVYYGDNKRPGHAIHRTPRGGNALLSATFAATHAEPPDRGSAPPFFVVTKGGAGREVLFRGVAVPGAPGLPPGEDLVAVWRTTAGRRFQNYRAAFTILDAAVVSRAWINDLNAGIASSPHAPAAWADWVQAGRYSPLQAPRSVEHRSKGEQLPSTPGGWQVLRTVHGFFQGDPFRFEECAAEIARLLDPNIIEYELTRPWVDGGRDAIGKYRIGGHGMEVLVDFALEAKCYDPGSAVGVRHTSRLISRLRHRQFGILVTTSYVHPQAYREIKEDAHPVIIVSGGDIVEILARNRVTSVAGVKRWLATHFAPLT